MRRKGRTVGLGASIESLVRKLDRRSGGAYLQTRAAQLWIETAGPGVAAHTTGAHLKEGEMVVYVDSPIWATELSALAEEYRKKINEQMGQDAVRSMRFSVSRKVGEQRRIELAERQAEEAAGGDRFDSIPLSVEERAQVEASASVIEDEGLREAVIRATVADLEWKKGATEAKNR